MCTAGGRLRQLQQLQRQFYWDNMESMVLNWVPGSAAIFATYFQVTLHVLRQGLALKGFLFTPTNIKIRHFFSSPQKAD